MEKCVVPGCGYEAKTTGAITAHLKRAHADNKLDVIRGKVLGAPRPGGALTSRPMTVVPTGVPSFDYATEVGGAPRGTIIEIFGKSASGKTAAALTFSAFVQQRGGRAGFMDTERALQPTFLKIINGLDAEALEYGTPPDYNGMQIENDRAAESGLELPYSPAEIKSMKDAGYDGSGEAALEVMRQMIETGMFDVFTLDSIYHSTPRSMLNLPIGHSNTRAALAQMFGQALQVLEVSVANTNTLLILINHVKSNPNAGGYGKDWSKPAGAAIDYAASMQLFIVAKQSYRTTAGQKIGHRVSVRMHKSKVNAPSSVAEFDLFYRTGTYVDKETKKKRVVTQTGIDIDSSWLSVAKEEGLVAWKGNAWVNPDSGEVLGKSEEEVREQLRDVGSPLRVQLQPIVYPPAFQSAQG